MGISNMLVSKIYLNQVAVTENTLNQRLFTKMVFQTEDHITFRMERQLNDENLTSQISLLLIFMNQK